MNILISYNWLKHYAAIKDAPDVLARKISLCGPSVERINHIIPQFTNVVVGEILDIKKHPNADRLNVAQVDVGEKKPRQIVFGQMAKMEVGFKVSVALAPAMLPGNKEIKRAELRGVLSEGMLCLDQELGLSSEGISITFFDKRIKNGVPVAKVLDLEDYIFDTEITTNRPDALGIVGYAREVSAITGAKFLWKETVSKKKTSFDKLGMTIVVKVEDKKACPRYMAAAMNNIKVKESPFWLKKRLLSAGLRPINNIVDITNYVMLEYGQPLHAFDADKLENFSVSPFEKGGLRGIPEKKLVKNIIVRRAKNGESITTLDGVKRKLTADNLVISDSVKPIAVAGVMGGANTAVSESTKNIIFEAANFNPLAIRKSARSLNLHSDSSGRFEKGLSAEFPMIAIMRAMELAADLAGAEQTSKIIDVKNAKHRLPRIKLEWAYLYEKLGMNIAPARAIKILQDLGFKIAAKNKKQLVAVAPYWREGDMEIAEDLVEEIARVYGYHNLPLTLPKGDVPLNFNYLDFAKEEKAKDFLCGVGFTEIYSSSMVSEKLLTNFGLKTADTLKLKNPLNEDLVYMRTSLIPSLLNVLARNIQYKKEANIFELANIYRIEAGKELPEEEMTLALAISGAKNTFGELKGIFDLMAKKFGIAEIDLKFEPAARTGYHPGRTAAVKIGKSEMGVMGEIHPLVLKKFGLDIKVAAAELNWKIMIKLAANKKTFVPIYKFPAVKMDLAIVLDKKIAWSEVNAEILSADTLVKNIELFDMYTGDKVGQGKKSLAFHITYQSNEKTLNDEEIKRLTDKIIERLKNKFGAELRK